MALELCATSDKPLPALLERFRGGTAVLSSENRGPATVPVERWFLWVCALKRALDGLEASVKASILAGGDSEKILNDIKGMRGSMTTFNVLFKSKEDHFVGQKGA
jgi:hypothetical protein